ncbi:MAG: MATE family efflux transporter [Bacillota bacterium]|nr:MATE family efflux transporter [Bacillota bacterium]
MKEHSLTEGSIIKGLVFFAIPLFLSMLFQTMYNTVDTVIIGHYLGDSALAAVGATAAIFELIVMGFGNGIGTGFGIVIARCFGSKDEYSLKKSVATSLVWGVIISLSLTVIFMLLLPTLLAVINTPADIIEDALSYIRIIALFSIVTIFYNLGSAMLRSIGDSVTPFIVLLFSSVINVILDIVCITSLGLGIQGAAIATVIAQSLSTVLCLFFVIKKAKVLIPRKEHFVFDGELLKDMLGQGFSMAMMSSIVSVGSMILQSGINGFGTSIIAGHVAARKMGSMLMLPVMTFGISVSTFVSQNKRAKQPDRIQAGVSFTNKFGIVMSMIMTVVVFLFAPTFIQWISGTSTKEVIEVGAMYMKINVPFYCVLCPLLTYRNALQGLGKKIIPLISSIIEFVGKIVFTFLIIPPLGYLGVCICEPVIWICMTIQLYFSYKKSIREFSMELQEQGI